MHAILDHRFIELRQRAVTALLHRHIDNHRTGLHGFHHIFSHQHGCGTTRNQGGGDDDVGLLDALGHQRCLTIAIVVAHVAGVTALPLGEFFFGVG